MNLFLKEKSFAPWLEGFYEAKNTSSCNAENKLLGSRIENLQKWTKAPGEYNDASILKMEQLNRNPAARAEFWKLIKVDYLKQR